MAEPTIGARPMDLRRRHFRQPDLAATAADFLGRRAAGLRGLLWLLSEILLPFVAGMALAYLLDPLADRLERLRHEPADRRAADRRRHDLRC